MGIVKIDEVEYNAKEIKLGDDSIKIMMSDNKEEAIDIQEDKKLIIDIRGYIKNCKIKGCGVVYGNIKDGEIDGTLILDGFLNKYINDVKVTRLNKKELDEIGFVDYASRRVNKIELIGTFDYFESNDEDINVYINGTIDNINCEKSLKVVGNVHQLKVGKGIIGSLSLIETPEEERLRKEKEQRQLESEHRLIESMQKEFKV